MCVLVHDDDYDDDDDHNDDCPLIPLILLSFDLHPTHFIAF